MELRHIAKAVLHPGKHSEVVFEIGEENVAATLIESQEDGDKSNFVVGVQDVYNPEQEMFERRYLKIRKHIMESRDTAVEVYESHDKLIKGIGATAVIAGTVTVGSLLVRWMHRH